MGKISLRVIERADAIRVSGQRVPASYRVLFDNVDVATLSGNISGGYTLRDMQGKPVKGVDDEAVGVRGKKRKNLEREIEKNFS